MREAKPKDPLPEILNIDQAKAALGCSEATLYRRIGDGSLTPMPKPPGLAKRHRLEFARSEINRFVAENGE